MNRTYPFAEGEQARINAQLKGVGPEAIRFWLSRRGYASFSEIDPHRRVSVAAGIAWDVRNAEAA